ncbi:MAG: MmcQ/YjbR family DNA-binding protein [Alphaproteobacteria bacterium]|nr:MmcQ/YjbR family DNA-binding protein [Alphaproteobacteria bacterium]
MASRKLSFARNPLAAIRRAVIAVPGLEEGTSYGTPAWRCRKKLLARLHQDGVSIVFWIDAETRDHLIAADPATFFVTDHYRGTVAVQARLDRLRTADLKKLLRRAVARVSPRP